MTVTDVDGGDALQESLSGVDSTIRVLHVDDDEHLLRLASKALSDVNDRLEVVTEQSGDAALERLSDEHFDCIVSDYQMPKMDGLQFLEAVAADHADVPFLLFTGKGSEEIAAKAIEAGVSGYLQKQGGLDHYTVLANRIETLVSQHRAEQRVRQSMQALEASRDGIAVFDEDDTFQYVNAAYAELYGYDPQELSGGSWTHLYPEREVERYDSEIAPALANQDAWIGECEGLHRDGSTFTSTHSISKAEGGGHVCVIHHGSISEE